MGRLLRFFGVTLTAASVACGDESLPPSMTRDGGVAADAGSAPPTLALSPELVAGLDTDAVLGSPLDLVVLPDGRPAVLYAAVPAGEIRRRFRLAVRTGADQWEANEAFEPAASLTSQGNLLAVSAAVWEGSLHAAYLGGDDDGNAITPYATDLMLATRSGSSWAERVLVDTSGESMGDCPDLQDYCNFGNVVGSHAALATDGNGAWAVAYRDTHGGLGADDEGRSDLEIYSSAGGARLADGERGGGLWSNLAFLPDGKLVGVHVRESVIAGQQNRGIQVVRETSSGFESTPLVDSATSQRIALGVAPDGQIWIAWSDPSANDLMVATATRAAGPFQVSAVDSAGVVGLHPDLAIAPDGAPWIVYGYCGPTGSSSCPGDPGARAEVRLARLEGASWDIQTISDGEGRGAVGFFNRIEFLPDGRAMVVTQDLENSDILGVVVQESP